MNTRSSFEITKPEMRLSIDRNRAATMGVSIQDLSQTLQVLFGGLDLSSITSDGKEYEVIAQLNRESRLRPEDLDKLYVRNSRDELIQINSIVSQTTGVAPNSIHHFNRLRSAKISASPRGIPIGATIEKTEDLLERELPEGFLYDWDGETREMLDASSTIWWYIVMALIIVYMVLASQFESLIHPLTVILAVPLAAFGAFGALWFLSRLNDWGITDPIPGMTFNLFSQIGLVLLIGLVTKNSILLVEFANQGKALGLNAREAMLKAGAVRFRPILMTAISTIAGILPIAIGFGVGAESRRPMGVVVVGGMLTSTFLTLFVIPSIYSSFDELILRLKSLKG
jgi:multidrug efflux pump